MRPLRRTPRRQGQSGEVQFSLIITVVGLLAAAYLSWAVWPAFSQNLELTSQLHAIVNQAWHRMGKRELHTQVMLAIGQIGSHLETPAGGEPTETRGLQIDDDSVVVTCTDQTQDCSSSLGDVHIDVNYSREMPLPGLQDQSITLHFSPSASATLEPSKW